MDRPTLNESGAHVGKGGDNALMKIDVETSEGIALDGAMETIILSRLVILIEVMGGWDYKQSLLKSKSRSKKF